MLEKKRLYILLITSIFYPLKANSQIIPDNTLGAENSLVKTEQIIKNTPSELIEGGAIRGDNLFHSFLEFNINEGKGAYFQNTEGINNILTRVTGNNISQILGTLGVLGNANLFLLNPNGIVFGSHTSLDLNGSFLATTADSILFDNYEFSASNPQPPPLLNITIPLGLNVRNNPGNIVFAKNIISGENQEYPTAETFKVGKGKTLALIGGNISLDGVQIKSPDSHIKIGGLQEKGMIKINQDLNFDFPDNVIKADVFLINQALIDVIGNGQGSIEFIVRNLETNNSFLKAGIAESNPFANNQAGNILINVTEDINLKSDSTISNEVLEDAQGDAGSIIIDTNNLNLKDGSNIEISIFGKGDAGAIKINARDKIYLTGESLEGPQFETVSRIFNTIRPTGVGNNQGIFINTGFLTLEGGAMINGSTFGQGNPGAISLKATETIHVTGNNRDTVSAIFSGTLFEGKGSSGGVFIDTKWMILEKGGQINTTTFGQGNSGAIEIKAKDGIFIMGKSPQGIIKESGVYSQIGGQLGDIAQGNSGGILIESNVIYLKEEGNIGVDNKGQGDGGNIFLTAKNLYLDDKAGISATTAIGKGGNIILKIANTTLLTNQSFITATVRENGNGGNIDINGKFLININGSDITANAFQGKGGNINITAEGIFLKKSLITASSQLGIDGVVKIIGADIHPLRSMAILPTDVIDPSQLIAENVCQQGKENEFMITGKGGFPSNPNQLLERDMTEVGLINPIFTETTPETQNQSNLLTKDAQQSITPARGWIRNEKGEVMLVGYNPHKMPSNELRKNDKLRCQPR